MCVAVAIQNNSTHVYVCTPAPTHAVQRLAPPVPVAVARGALEVVRPDAVLPERGLDLAQVGGHEAVNGREDRQLQVLRRLPDLQKGRGCGGRVWGACCMPPQHMVRTPLPCAPAVCATRTCWWAVRLAPACAGWRLPSPSTPLGCGTFAHLARFALLTSPATTRRQASLRGRHGGLVQQLLLMPVLLLLLLQGAACRCAGIWEWRG